MIAALPLTACGDETSSTSSSSGTSSGTGGGGGTTSSSGTGGGGGTTSSGTGGGGGTTSSGTAGSGGVGGGADFWDGAYDPNGLPNPSDGEHNDGDYCMSCHASGGDQWLFGGTVYETGGSNGAANVQVGLLLDGTLYTAYSGDNGNFWVADPGGSPNWANAEVRFRNANGETIMVGAATAACNSCHTGGMALIEP